MLTVRATQQKPREDALSSYVEDDFVCDAPICTPAIAQTLRALAQDIRGLKYSASLFAREVQYQDGLRSFKGSARYDRTRWAAESVSEAKASVKTMRIVDSARAQIDWRLTGSVVGVPIDVAVQSQTQHSMVTGKISLHRDVYDLSACSALAKVVVTASRLAWAAKNAALDAGEGLDKAGNKLSGALDGMTENDNAVNPDPTDPTKFFQQEGNQNADLWQAGTVLAVVYFVFKAYTEVMSLH